MRTMSGRSAYLFALILEDKEEKKKRRKKKRHLSDSNTRGQRPTALLYMIAGDPVNHSGKVTHTQMDVNNQLILISILNADNPFLHTQN